MTKVWSNITFFETLTHAMFFIKKLCRMSSTFAIYRLPYFYLFHFKGGHIGIRAYPTHLEGLVCLFVFETMICTVSDTCMHEKGIVNSKRMPQKRYGGSLNGQIEGTKKMLSLLAICHKLFLSIFKSQS